MEMTEAVKAKMDTITGNLDTLVKDLQPRIKSLEEKGEGVAELKEQANKLVEENAKLHDELKSITDRIDGVETGVKEYRQGALGDNIGAKLTEGFKDLSDDYRGKKAVDVPAERFISGRKDITNLTASGGPLLVSDYNEAVVGPGTRRLTIRDLLSVGTTSRSSVTFMRELAQTGGPDYQEAQGDKKEATDFTFEQKTEQVVTIAHYTKIARQMMADVPALTSYIQGRMRFLLEQKFEDELLNGAGGSTAINGINTQADAFDTNVPADIGASATLLDTLGAAAYQVSTSHFLADGIVINPQEGWRLRMAKDGEDRYLFANPASSNSNLTPWGLPAVETPAQAAGEFTVGAFRAAAQLFMREQATARISSENEDDFIRNLVTLLVELRAVLAVYRPSAFVHGTYTEGDDETGGGGG